MDIVVLGSFIQACCWKVPRLPKPGETLTASELLIELGGKGLNVAIGTRRLGADVELLLGIGQDAAGDRLMELLKHENIPTTHVWRLAEKSGHGAGFIADDGQNMISIFPGPNLLLTETHVDQAETALQTATLVYAQLETSLTAVIRAFKIARRHGIRTVLNVSPWIDLPTQLLDYTDVLLINEIEASQLLGLSTPLPESLADWCHELSARLAPYWLQWPGSLIVVTLGRKGSIAVDRSGKSYQASAFIVDTIDSTGAGDAFASGFCIEMAKNSELETALLCGNACGALAASKLGVLHALPDQATLQKFVRSQA